MNKSRIISLILALAVIFSVFGASAVFATGESTVSDSSAVSYSDVVSATDHLADYPTYELDIDQHRLSMTLPNIDSSFSANSTNADLLTALPESDYNLESIINFSDQYYSGDVISYLYSGASVSGSIMVNILYSTNNYTQFIGDYSALNDERLEDLRTTALSFNGSYPEIRTINGNVYLYAEGNDEQYGYYSYSLETIINGGRYRIYIDLTDPSPADLAAAAEMIRSIKIGGLRPALIGAADKTLVTVLLVAVIILLILVGLLTFFIIRFSLYSSAAGSKFNIIGFNMPPKKAELERYRKERERAERKKRQSSANKPAPKSDDRTVSLTDSLSDD